MLFDLRQLYNAALEHRMLAYAKGVSVQYRHQQLELTTARRELPHLRRWSCCCEQGVLRRLERTFKRFFASRAKGASHRYPRFKSGDRFHSADLRLGNGLSINTSGRIAIFGVPGRIKVEWHRPLPKPLGHAVITRNAGKWYIIFHVDLPQIERASPDVIGIDLGLSALAALSDGTVIARPNATKVNKRRLRRLQRAMFRSKKGSKRRAARRAAVKRLQAHIAASRRDFLHKQSRYLVDRYGRIAVENLDVKRMARGIFAKEVYDASWSQFLHLITYKAENAGGEVVRVNPRGTSQTCPNCSRTKVKSLSVREHICECGLRIDRDVAAAMVVHQRAFGFSPGAGDGLLTGPGTAKVGSAVAA